MATKRPSTKDLRALPDADIRQQLDALRQELWQSRLKAKEGSLQQTHQIPAARRQIARIHTLLAERKPQEAKG